MHYLQTKDYVQCPSDTTRHTATFIAAYKVDVHICLPCHSAMSAIRKRSSAASDAPATRMKRLEELEPTNFCTYWPNNPAFYPKRVLLRRLFFINEAGPNTCLLVSVLLATIYHWWNLGLSGGGGPKTLILSDEQVDELAEALPMLQDAMCSGETCWGSQVREWCLSVGFDQQSANLLTLTVLFQLYQVYGVE
jgi:hypothetical protein